LISIKKKDEIKRMIVASEIVSEALQAIKKAVAPGITTKALEEIAEDIIRTRGGKPAFKGYKGFPASICTSVNDEVVHGIPSEEVVLKEGDIVSIDLGVIYKGYISDAAITLPVGAISESAARLLSVTKQALFEGIAKAVPSNRVGDISHAIQSYVESKGYSVVRKFVGHGVGRRLHEEPQVPNFGLPGEGIKLREGMTLAIEPMVNEGTHDVSIMEDGWTAKTKDGKLSAHFEHTILIKKNGPEILTKW
jgi:methionyl aminopeptidase